MNANHGRAPSRRAGSNLKSGRRQDDLPDAETQFARCRAAEGESAPEPPWAACGSVLPSFGNRSPWNLRAALKSLASTVPSPRISPKIVGWAPCLPVASLWIAVMSRLVTTPVSKKSPGRTSRRRVYGRIPTSPKASAHRAGDRDGDTIGLVDRLGEEDVVLVLGRGAAK